MDKILFVSEGKVGGVSVRGGETRGEIIIPVW